MTQPAGWWIDGDEASGYRFAGPISDEDAERMGLDPGPPIAAPSIHTVTVEIGD